MILCEFLTNDNKYYTLLDQRDTNSIRRYLGKVLKWLNDGLYAEGTLKEEVLQNIKIYESSLGKADIHTGLMTGTTGPGNSQSH